MNNLFSGFLPSITYSTGGAYPSGIVVRDFNNDSRVDIVISNYFGYSVLIGNQSGTFQPAKYYNNTLPDSLNFNLGAGDFNNDGRLDFASTGGVSGLISVFIGNGDGTFQKSITYSVGNNANTIGITINDFNNDGKLDLATANQYLYSLTVFLGNGDGTFKGPDIYNVDYPYSIISADFNKDGKVDLANTNWGGGSVSVLLGNGDGTFINPVSYKVDAASTGITSADFNKDGKLDLANVNYNENGSMTVLIGNGDGTFQPAVSYSAGVNTLAIANADINRDCNIDLIVTGALNNISVFWGNGDGTFQDPTIYAVGSPSNVVAIDYDGKGIVALAVPDIEASGAVTTFFYDD